MGLQSNGQSSVQEAVAVANVGCSIGSRPWFQLVPSKRWQHISLGVDIVREWRDHQEHQARKCLPDKADEGTKGALHANLVRLSPCSPHGQEWTNLRAWLFYLRSTGLGSRWWLHHGANFDTRCKRWSWQGQAYCLWAALFSLLYWAWLPLLLGHAQLRWPWLYPTIADIGPNLAISRRHRDAIVELPIGWPADYSIEDPSLRLHWSHVQLWRRRTQMPEVERLGPDRPHV